jgi:hypothetical protein
VFGVLVEGTGDDVLARVGGETLKEGWGGQEVRKVSKAGPIQFFDF